MKRTLNTAALTVAITAAATHGAVYSFDANGASANFFNSSASISDWSVAPPTAGWRLDGTGSLESWPTSGGPHEARFDFAGTTTGDHTVNLSTSISNVSRLTAQNGSFRNLFIGGSGGSHTLTLVDPDGAGPLTAVVDANNTGIQVVGGTNGARLAGDFTKRGLGGLFFQNNTSPTAYNGTITVEQGGVNVAGNTWFGTNSRFALNGGTLRVDVTNLTPLTIGALSGTSTASVIQGRNGNLTGGATSYQLIVDQASDTSYAGQILNGSGHSLPASDRRVSLIKAGAGTLRLTNATGLTYTGTTNINGGQLLVDGSHASGQDAYAIGTNGTLGGDGNIGTFISNSGTIAPGSITEIGTLSTGGVGFQPGSFLRIQLAGTLPGDLDTNYDQLNASGGVTISGSVFLLPSILGSFTPTTGNVFYILSRGDGGAFTNTFSGLPEGATVNLGGGWFSQITYQANWTGTQSTSSLTGGNDVALHSAFFIPEPSVLVLLVPALLLILRRN